MHEDCVKRENYQRIQQKFCFVFSFHFFLTNVMHIISATDFPLFCSNFARTCLILPAECSFQNSPFLLEILPAEFIEAYAGIPENTFKRKYSLIQSALNLRFPMLQSIRFSELIFWNHFARLHYYNGVRGIMIPCHMRLSRGHWGCVGLGDCSRHNTNTSD